MTTRSAFSSGRAEVSGEDVRDARPTAWCAAGLSVVGTHSIADRGQASISVAI